MKDVATLIWAYILLESRGVANGVSGPTTGWGHDPAKLITELSISDLMKWSFIGLTCKLLRYIIRGALRRSMVFN